MQLNPFKFFEKISKKQEVNQITEDELQKLPEVSTGTKMKVVFAIMIVGFAAYTAYWVQSPSEVQVDVLSSDTSTVGQSNTGGNETEFESSETAETEKSISIINFNFDPSTLDIEKGMTVTWTNNDSVQHTVTAEKFSSGALEKGQTFSYTFEEDGVFEYTSTFYPQMKGYIAVGEAAQAELEKKQSLSGFGGEEKMATVESQLAETAIPASGEAIQTAETSPAPVTAPLSALETASSIASQALSQTTFIQTPEATEIPETLTLPTANEPPEAAFAISAEAPEISLRGAPIEPLSQSVKKIVKKGKIANSGPEDFIYGGIFFVILYLNRKRFMKKALGSQ